MLFAALFITLFSGKYKTTPNRNLLANHINQHVKQRHIAMAVSCPRIAHSKYHIKIRLDVTATSFFPVIITPPCLEGCS